MQVFFYGLFMDETLLAAKAVSPTESAVGYVEGFALHIGERATLLPEAGARAYGVLMNVTSAEAAKLYSEPSVADYIAESLVVHLPGDVQVPAVSYNLPAAKLSGANPEYAAALAKLAAGLGLPDSYVERIRSIAAAS